MPLDEIFKQSDYLTLHVGLTTQTEGMINATSLKHHEARHPHRQLRARRAHRRRGARRGPQVRPRRRRGARCLPQGAAQGLAYFGLDNVLLSPHIAGSTDEAQEAIGIQLAMQVRDYLKLGVVQNAVNLPSLSHEEYVELAPYIEMAERLGLFLSHAAPGNLENIQITYAGRLAQGKTDLIRNAAICGVLADSESASTASTPPPSPGARHPHPGRQEGVHHRRLGQHAQDRAALLRGQTPAHPPPCCTATRRACSPTTASTSRPRCNGTLLAIRNHDVPGVIGRIGTILGEHSLNIANFALGRSVRSQRVPQGQALAVVQIDVQNPATPTQPSRRCARSRPSPACAWWISENYDPISYK